MKRWIWSAFIVLLSLSSSIMTIQWKSFNDENEQQGMEQQIVVSHHTDFFYVEQHLKGLMAGDQLTINYPKNMKDFTCQLGNETCNEEKIFKIEEDINEIRFTYMIPSKQAKDVLIMDNWLVEVEGVPIHSTYVQLSDAKWREGSWLIGTDLIAKKEMENSDYYMFESQNNQPPIYWQKDRLENIYSDKNYHILATKNKVSTFKTIHFKEDLQEDDVEKTTIIFNPLAKKKEYHNLKIMNDAKEFAELNEQLIKDQIQARIELENQDQWLYDVILSVGLDEAIGTKKTKEMYKELKEHLDSEQLNNWFEQLLLYDEGSLTPVILDELFEVENSMKVHFFNENKKESEKMTALQFVSTKKVIINELEANDLFIHYDDETPYVLLESIAYHLGYYYVNEQKEDVITVYKKPITYHFYPGQRIFQLNEDRYGLKESPVVQFNGENYMSLEVLPAFFNVDITEDEQSIYINTLRTS